MCQFTTLRVSSLNGSSLGPKCFEVGRFATPWIASWSNGLLAEADCLCKQSDVSRHHGGPIEGPWNPSGCHSTIVFMIKLHYRIHVSWPSRLALQAVWCLSASWMSNLFGLSPPSQLVIGYITGYRFWISFAKISKSPENSFQNIEHFSEQQQNW